jgi:O-antigen/teichoic acid export membrane protein
MNFVLIFFTTFYLSTQEVGQLDLIFVTLNLVLPLVTFQLSDAAFRWLLENDSEDNRVKIFSNVTVLLMLSFCFYGIAYLVYNYFFPFVSFYPFAGLVFFQMFNVFLPQFIRGIGNNREYVVRSLAITFLYVSFSIVSLTIFKLKVEGLIYANVLAGFLGSMILLLRTGLYRYFKFSAFSVGFSKKLLVYSLPLIPNNLSWWAISSANRYFILLFLGAAANGVFAIAFKLPTILSIFMNIFYLAWQEKAIRTYNDEDRDRYYSLTFEKFVRILFSVSIVILATNKLALHFIVSKEFFTAWRYTPVLLAGLIFSSMAGFYGTGFLSTKNTKGALTSSAFSAMLTLALSWLTIPLIGLYGASLAMSTGYLVLFLMRVRQTRKYFHIRFPLQTFVHFSGLFLLVALLSFGDLRLQVANIMIALVCIVWLNLEETKALLRSLKMRSAGLPQGLLKNFVKTKTSVPS